MIRGLHNAVTTLDTLRSECGSEYSSGCLRNPHSLLPPLEMGVSFELGSWMGYCSLNHFPAWFGRLLSSTTVAKIRPFTTSTGFSGI